MFVSRHFQEDAKEAMLEMVGDIRKEFKHILEEVTLQRQPNLTSPNLTWPEGIISLGLGGGPKSYFNDG